MNKNTIDWPKGRGNDQNLAVYIPTTQGIRGTISNQERQRRINSVVSFFRYHFRGSTRVRAVGNFASEELKGSVTENIIVVETFTDHNTYARNDYALKNFMYKKKREWGQESLALEYNGRMFFV